MKRLLLAALVVLAAAPARAEQKSIPFGGTFYGNITTLGPTSAATFTGSPALAVYRASSNVQSTCGITLNVDHDGLTGYSNFAIDTSCDASFYAVGTQLAVVITSGTAGGRSYVGYVVDEFCIDCEVAASVTGSVASVTGNVGGNVVGSVGSVTGNVGGNVTGSVGSVAADGITASSIAADAIGASEIAANALGASEVADGAIDSGAIATDAVDADALAANAVTEIAAGLTIPTVGQIADQVWDEALAGHATAGSTGAALSVAGGAGDPWASVCSSFGTGTIGEFLCGLDQTSIVPLSPVLNAGTLELVAGDAYDNDHARSLDDFALTGQPSLTGATVTLVIDGVLSVTAGSVSGAGGATQTPIFELTAAQTALLTRNGEKAYVYQIQATWAADTPAQPAVLAAGYVKVVRRVSGS